MSAIPEPHLSLDEYYTLEEQGEQRHEYYRGRIFAMTGGTFRHNVIVGNVTANLHAKLRGKPCRVTPSDQRIKIEETGLQTYPDVSVICHPVQYGDNRTDVVTNPVVIVEVLSPRTASYDRKEKFLHYRTIPSLRAYLLIAQDTMQVTVFLHQDAHTWVVTEYTEAEQEIRLDAIGVAVTLADIYEAVTLGDDKG